MEQRMKKSTPREKSTISVHNFNSPYPGLYTSIISPPRGLNISTSFSSSSLRFSSYFVAAATTTIQVQLATLKNGFLHPHRTTQFQGKAAPLTIVMQQMIVTVTWGKSEITHTSREMSDCDDDRFRIRFLLPELNKKEDPIYFSIYSEGTRYV